MFNVKFLCPYVKGELRFELLHQLAKEKSKHHINIPRTALVPQETEESIIN